MVISTIRSKNTKIDARSKDRKPKGRMAIGQMTIGRITIGRNKAEIAKGSMESFTRIKQKIN